MRQEPGLFKKADYRYDYPAFGIAVFFLKGTLGFPADGTESFQHLRPAVLYGAVYQGMIYPVILPGRQHHIIAGI